MMLNFWTSVSIFYTLLGLSAIASFILFISYQRAKQSLLLRSTCVLVVAMLFLVIIGHFIPHHPDQILDAYGYCESQAVLLNFCFIGIHAHVALMVFDNCYLALNWNMKLFKYLDRDFTLILLGYTLPIFFLVVPVLYLVAVGDLVNTVVPRPGPFYCSLAKPRFILSTLCHMLLTIPGTFLSVYLLYQTWLARQKTLKYGNTTQLTMPYLLRVSFSTMVYLMLAFGSFVPFLLWPEPEESPLVELLPPSRRSPWLNPAMCEIAPTDPSMEFYVKVLCPTPMSFAPALIGIALFCMYGFGTYARKTYHLFFQKYFRCAPKKRNSIMPHTRYLPNGTPPPNAMISGLDRRGKRTGVGSGEDRNR